MVESRCGERLGKGRVTILSGKVREGERERTIDEMS